MLSVIMYPTWNSQVEIPVLALLALGTWLFGQSTGFFLAFIAMIYHYLITSVIYGDFCVYYEDRLSGTILGLTIVFLTGNVRTSVAKLELTNMQLDQRVAERNAELGHLTEKLINNAETTRIRHGETLHDDIGQQLTGIQLYCSSLVEDMVETSNPVASLVVSMRNQAGKAHHIIRKTARLLFPVRMNETGLVPAVHELASCLNELEHLSVDVTIKGGCGHIPESVSLALYRIFHESAMCAAAELEADTIHLTIESQTSAYMLLLQHNGKPWTTLKDSMEQRLILYRLNMLGGMQSVEQGIGTAEAIIYRIPKAE
jgi:glucose-6-phosphate-specific signal transduction histidine kinase